jgi:predicted CxxxxCH...CXXCH cytochrome family protein
MDGTGTLSFGALATSGTGTAPSYNATSGTCSNTYCHFDKPHNALYAPAVTNAAVVWNNTAYLNGTVADCQKCHQSPPTTASGVHVGKAFPSSCNTCHNHVSPAGVITDATKHINGVVDASGGHSFPFPGASHLSLAGSTPWGDCSGCHNTSATGVTYTTWAANNRGTAPNCTTCHLNGLNTPDAVVKTSSCYDCHGASATDGMPNGSAFPNNAGSHTKHVVGQGLVCATCHNGGGNVTANHGNSNGVTRTIADITVASASGQFTFAWAGGPGVTPTCSSVACHGTAVWGVTTFDCVSCHSSLITITKGPLANGTNQRRAVASELTTSGSRNHKGTATGTAPTKWDCIVCHLEGDSATGSQASAYHGNGVLDFRDPDGTGNQPIKKVAWGGLPYAAGITDPGGRYIDTMTNFTTARFSRDLSLVLESDPAWLNVATIQMNLCLHCHDSNGAQNSTSWTKNAAGTVVGTAGQPFGLPVGNSSTQYWVTTTLMSAAGNTTGNVMNVFSQLSSANASSHPVTGRGNNGFAKGTQMKAPWSGGTNLPHASTTVYGYLISCFDCHGVLNSTGAQSSTVVAHGNGSTVTTAQLRAPYPTAALGGIAVSGSKNNLCTLCHADTYASTTNGHGPNSGITAGPASMTATTFGTCSNCHVTQTNNVGARAVAVHGYNATESASATFPTTNSRPYAFWRGGPQVLYWGPGSCSVSCTTQTYTTAGVY